MDTKVKQETISEEHNRLYQITRKLLLTSIGAVGMAQDEIEDLVGKLVERGEIAEKDGRKLIDNLNDRTRDALKHGRARVGGLVDTNGKKKDIEDILDEMDIPSKADITALSKKITELTKKVDQLKQD